MPTFERITVTLPAELLGDLDRRESNRSKFVAEAVRKELDFRRREELRRSLQNPHPESSQLASSGLEDWNNHLPAEDTESLLDEKRGKSIRWIPGTGWVSE
jgi:hypothetical protein